MAIGFYVSENHFKNVTRYSSRNKLERSIRFFYSRKSTPFQHEAINIFWMEDSPENGKKKNTDYIGKPPDEEIILVFVSFTDSYGIVGAKKAFTAFAN